MFLLPCVGLHCDDDFVEFELPPGVTRVDDGYIGCGYGGAGTLEPDINGICTFPFGDVPLPVILFTVDDARPDCRLRSCGTLLLLLLVKDTKVPLLTIGACGCSTG
jgi:hypothetical protein